MFNMFNKTREQFITEFIQRHYRPWVEEKTMQSLCDDAVLAWNTINNKPEPASTDPMTGT